MGDLLQALGLGGRSRSSVPVSGNGLMGPTATTPGEIGGMPVPATGTSGDSMADILVRGDGWKPKGVPFLAALGDAYLMSKGLPPGFAKKVENRNVREALQDYNSDPEAAIRRLMRVRGQQDKALQLYNQLRDNKRADLTAESLAETRKEKFFTRVGGMLNAVRSAKDPETAYQQNKPTIQRYIDARGLEEDIQLPDKWDPTAINNIILGNVSPEDQIKIEALQQYRDARLGLDTRKADDLRNYRTERLEDFDKAEAGRNYRDSTPTPKAPKGGGRDPRYIKTEKGWMNLSPSGNYGTIDNGTEIEMWKKVGPNKWERIGTQPKKGQ